MTTNPAEAWRSRIDRGDVAPSTLTARVYVDGVERRQPR